MALATLGLPIFSGGLDEDVETFIHNFRGHLHAIGVDPVGNSEQCKGILRGCLRGEAGAWYDENILGKRWRLNNLFNNTTQGTAGAIRGRTMNQLLASNSIRPGTQAHIYATGHGATTLGAGPVGDKYTGTGGGWLPLEAFYQDWSYVGGEPVEAVANAIANPGNNNPIILPDVRIGCVVWMFLEKYPTVVEDLRKIRFSTLYQGDEPIRAYYMSVKRAGKQLKIGDEGIENQFYRGMTEENLLEAERIGSERPLEDMVKALERVEKRKAEMKLGRSHREHRQSEQSKIVIPEPVPLPRIQQEPVVLKPETAQGISHEQLNQLLNAQAENLTKNFQTQIQALQDNIKQPTSQPARPPVPSKATRSMQEFYESHNPFDEYERKYSFDEIMGGAPPPPIPPKPSIIKIAERVARQLARSEERRQDRELARAMRNLSIDDPAGADEMDTSNMIRVDDNVGFNIIQDDDGEYHIQLARKKK